MTGVLRRTGSAAVRALSDPRHSAACGTHASADDAAVALGSALVEPLERGPLVRSGTATAVTVPDQPHTLSS